MAQYFTNFSGYTSGVQPTGWTARWQTANKTWTVENDAGATGGKLLRCVSANNNAGLLTWDAIDADANRDNVEIFFRFRSSGTGTIPVGGVVRASSVLATGNGYVSHPNDATSQRIAKFVSGSYALLTNHSNAWAADTWYYSRFRVNSTTLQMKRWAGAVGDEPGAWDSEVTNGEVTGVGWVGALSRLTGVTVDFDVIGVGTNGDTAPSQAPASSAPPRANMLGGFVNMRGGFING